MPLVGACHKVYTVAHLGLEEYHLRLAVRLAGDLKRVEYALEIVAVSYDDIPSESAPLLAEVFNSGDGGSRTVNLLAVPVGEGHEIVHLVVNCPHTGFPNLAFFALSVSAEAEYPRVVSVHLLAEGDAGCH